MLFQNDIIGDQNRAKVHIDLATQGTPSLQERIFIFSKGNAIKNQTVYGGSSLSMNLASYVEFQSQVISFSTINL